MKRKRLLGAVLLILLCGTGWFGWQAVNQAALNHDLILASATGNPVTVRALLQQGADPNAVEDNTVGIGWQQRLSLMLRHKESLLKMCPLSQVLAAGSSDADHLEIVRLLLERGANPNLVLPGQTPFPVRALVIAKEERLLTLFLQHGADPNTVDATGASLLMYAVNAHRESWVRALLERGAKPDLANLQGDVPLMWAAYERETKIAALLLAHGADVNHKNRRGLTALMYALFAADSDEMIKLLLAAGADVNAPDAQGCTPFLYALTMRTETNRLLLAHGGDVRRSLPPRISIQNIIIEFQMENSSRTMSMSFAFPPGTTPLMLAVRSHDFDLVRGLLAKGADAEARDAQGNTALFYAASQPEVCALLKRAETRH